MRKSLLFKLLLHIPLLVSAVILGVYSLDSELIGRESTPRIHVIFLFPLIPMAVGLALVQVGIWMWMAVKQFGRRRAFIYAVVIVVLVGGVRHIVGRIGLWGVEREAVVASNTLYRCNYGDFMFAVSPDERWLIYARESGRVRDGVQEIPEIVVRDLHSGEDRVVGVDVVRKDRYFTVAEELTMVLNEPHWMEQSARFRIRRGVWLEIDLESAKARSLSPKNVTPVRPSSDEFRTYLAARTEKGKYDAAVAWDGSTIGKYIYSAVDTKTSWRTIGAIERTSGDGKWERLTTRREIFADWWVHKPVVSPDGRFVAYTGRRDKLSNLYLQLVIPLLGFGNMDRDYLFVYDTQSGRDYKLGMVDDVVSPQWSGDSRRFYYAELNPWRERQIYSIHFDVPPSEPVEGRIAWEPTSENIASSYILPSGNVKLSLRDSDPYAGWESFSVGEVLFRYPADELTFSDEDGVVRLEHAVDFTHRNPCAGGREIHQLKDFYMTVAVVDKSCDKLVPNGTPRGRLRPGYARNALTRCYLVVEGEADCKVERWYCPMAGDKTLIVSRQHTWAPGLEDPMRDAYLGLDGLIDSGRANQIFNMVASSIKVNGY